MKLAFAAEVREMDRRVIEGYGLPGVALMEAAGKGATDHLCATLLAGREAARVAIFCGPGNNGGDGYVMARHLAARGHSPEVFLLADPARIAGDAALNLGVIERMRLPVTRLDAGALDDEGFALALSALGGAGRAVSVDALLGTGLEDAPRGRYAQLIERLNALSAPRFAVDIPSGLSADTGQAPGAAIVAAATATFGVSKPGLHLLPGRDHVGALAVIDLGFTPTLIAQAGARGARLARAWARAHLPPRDADAHKGTCGRVLVLGGAPGKSGAVILSGAATIRSGAGLVTVGTRPACVDQVATVCWELMSASLIPADGALGSAATARLDDALSGMDVVAIGPGLGTDAAARGVLDRVLERFAGQVVLDADALNLLAGRLDALDALRGRAVLTPHPGEMGRLIGASPAQVQASRLSAARALAARHGVVVVLKSGSTVVAHPDGRYAVNATGTPAMASAGMGDALTGIIAGLLGQGHALFEAACLGVCVHGLAGERGARRAGQRGLTASALVEALPATFADLEPGAAPTSRDGAG